MHQKPTRDRIKSLIQAITERSGGLAGGPAEFAVTSIYCRINEGIPYFVTHSLPCRKFNFAGKWVEFPTERGGPVVRRRLSDETAQHVKSRIDRFSRGPDDVVHGYECKLAQCHPNYYGQIEAAGFTPAEFHMRTLAWIWIDDHPELVDLEERARVLARAILEWSKPHQQEALFRKIFDNSPVLRPSWAYPVWHKDAQKPVTEVKGQTAESQPLAA